MAPPATAPRTPRDTATSQAPPSAEMASANQAVFRVATGSNGKPGSRGSRSASAATATRTPRLRARRARVGSRRSASSPSAASSAMAKAVTSSPRVGTRKLPYPGRTL